jgi:hypothetical protein
MQLSFGLSIENSTAATAIKIPNDANIFFIYTP